VWLAAYSHILLSAFTKSHQANSSILAAPRVFSQGMAMLWSDLYVAVIQLPSRPESRIVGQLVIIAQMPITQQFLAVLVGSGQDEQSAFELHELGQTPLPELLPPAPDELELPPPEEEGPAPEEPPETPLEEPPRSPPLDEEPAGSLLAPTEPPASSPG
jgi:hypothetical protein